MTTEGLLSKPIKWGLGEANYWPGMGLVTGFILLFLIGLAVNAFLVRRLLGLGEDLLLRVPVVKTVYSAIRDMTRLVNTDKKKGVGSEMFEVTSNVRTNTSATSTPS